MAGGPSHQELDRHQNMAPLPESPTRENIRNHTMVPHAGHTVQWQAEIDEGDYLTSEEDPYISADEEEVVLGNFPASMGIQAIAPEFSKRSDKKDRFTTGIDRSFHHMECIFEDRKAFDTKTDVHPAELRHNRSPMLTRSIFTPGNEGKQHGSIKLPEFPTISILLQLPSHLQLCEQLLYEEGIDIERLKCKVAIVNTLTGLKELKDSASSMINLPWAELKENLLNEFADSNFLRSEIEKEMGKLRFDPTKMVAFVHEARRLWSMRTDDIDKRWFISQLFRHVPDDIARDVISVARSVNRRVDWRVHEFNKLISWLNEAVLSRSALQELRMGSAPRVTLDKIRLVKNELSSWIDDHKNRLWYVHNPSTDLEGKLREAAESIKVCTRRKDNVRYILVAFKSRQSGEDILGQLCPGSQFREFKAKN
jgi:hypothetical protein